MAPACRIEQLVGSLAALAACTPDPTSLLVHITTAPGVSVQNLSAQVMVAATGGVATQSLPQSGGRPRLPADALVVVPDLSSDVTVTLTARDDRGRMLETSATVRSVPHEQVELTMVLGAIPAQAGWYKLPQTTLRAVCPPSTSRYDYHYACQSIVRSESGAIADTSRNRMVLWGGSQYLGNELYALNLTDLSLTRLNDPSPSATDPMQPCVEALPDGTPSPRGPAGGVAYIKHRDRLFVFGGSLACSRNNAADTWTLDLAQLTWQRMDPVAGPDHPRPGPAANADYDPNTQKVFFSDGVGFFQYDYDVNTYTLLDANAPTDYHMTGSVDPKRKRFILVGCRSCQNGGMKAFDISPTGSPGIQDWTARVTGCDALLASDWPGLAYDSKQGLLVGWPNSGDSVYLFDADTLTCTAKTFPGGPPNAPNLGTFGRWRYFPGPGVLALIQDWEVDAFTLRMVPAP